MRFLTRLRVVGTSATAAATGLVNVALAGRRRIGTTRLRVGDVVPEFSLPASDGRQYRLSTFRHQQIVVVAWFPKAFTGGCAVQCESLARGQHRLARTGAAIFGANMDSPETNRQFAEATGLEFPILSDQSGNVARAFGVLGASGFPARRTFFIGMDGRLLAIDDSVKVVTHAADIEARLKQLQRVDG